MIEGLVEAVERNLGTITGGWHADPDGTPMPFRVVQHQPGRIDDAEIYSTLGLSDHLLESPFADGVFRTELLMIVPAGSGGPVPGILLEAGRMIVERREIPSIGDLFRNVPDLRQISSMDILYCGRPLYFPSEFGRFTSGGTVVNFIWLMPVWADEAAFVERDGWQAFEQLMYDDEHMDPIDFHRPSMLA